jgi:hypothetical protein
MELRVLPMKPLEMCARAGLTLVLGVTSACGPASGEKPASSPAETQSTAAVATRSVATPPIDPDRTIAPEQPASIEPAEPMPPAAAVGATNASLAAETPLPAETAPVALPSGTTVLHIGDSFAGALGIELNREFKEAGVRGILKYETATYIPTWASGKDLETYLSKYHPDLVLITLGANELEIPDPAQRAATIRRLVGRLAGRPCVWVAPPLWHGARPALLDVIRESCAPCAYLDSGELVPELPRAKDGIHPAMAARKAWAKAVITWLGQHRKRGETQPWRIE